MREMYANKPSRRKLKRMWNIETNSTTEIHRLGCRLNNRSISYLIGDCLSYKIKHA